MLMRLKKLGLNMWLSLKPYLWTLPAMGMIALLFFGGFFIGFLESLGYFSLTGESRISFRPYVELLGSPDFWQSISYTLRITMLATLISALIGLGLALGWMQSRALSQRALQFPMLLPHLAAAYLIVLLFMQSGWLSRMAYALGWIEEMNDFPIFVHDPFGWGIVMAYVWKESPFIALMLIPVLQRIQANWREAACMLGAGRGAYFRDIVFPLLLPSWTAASFIVFAFTFSAFEVPLLLGVTYPEMISVYSYRLFSGDFVEERPKALAVNILIALITAFLGAMAYRLSKRWLGEERRGWN